MIARGDREGGGWRVFCLRVRFPFRVISSFGSYAYDGRFWACGVLCFFTGLRGGVLDIRGLGLFVLFGGVSLFT